MTMLMLEEGVAPVVTRAALYRVREEVAVVAAVVGVGVFAVLVGGVEPTLDSDETGMVESTVAGDQRPLDDDDTDKSEWAEDGEWEWE